VAVHSAGDIWLCCGCVFGLFSFSKAGIIMDIKIILGLRTWRTVCGTLALVLTQFV